MEMLKKFIQTLRTFKFVEDVNNIVEKAVANIGCL